MALANGFTQTIAALSAWAAVGPTAAAQGWVPYLWATIAGGGTVATTIQTAVALTTPAVVGVAAYVATNWIARQIILASQENRVPALVTKTISEMAETISAKMEVRGQQIAATYRSLVDEQIASNQERLRDLEQSIKHADPHLKQRLTEQAEVSRSLLGERKDLGHSLSLITALPDSHV